MSNMATGGTPNGRDNKPAGRMSSLSEPRPKRRPAPRFDTSLDTELSLNTELRRSEDSAHLNHRSLPNNLGWSLGTGSNMAERLTPTGGQKKAKPFEHVILQEGASSPDSSSQPSEFRRKKHHTPATIPRTKLPAGTPKAERDALARLRQQINFEEEIPTRGPRKSTMQDTTSRSSAANNERSIRSPGAQVIPVQESNDADTALANDRNAEVANDKVDTTQILERLRQVRDFLKQATEMFVTMSFEGNEEQMTKEYEQAAKLHRLIKHLKNQEKAYTDLLERTLAMEGDLTTENTPSVSVQSVSDDEKGETPSIREEELQGLRQQHALLQKMLEQQRQLKELQSRQAALLTLQRDAEQRLAEAEEEDDEGAVGGYDTASERSRTGTDASQLSQATNEFSTADDPWGFNPEQLALQNFIWRSKEKQTAHLRNEKDRDDSNERRPKKNQPPSNTLVGASADLQSVSDSQPDNEEAALAIADAAQERLELENKLMALQAKREQMDSLLNELQLLRETQLRKESIEARKPHVSSVNVAKKDNNDEKPLATTSQKLDDDSILEALEVHQKLKRLQDLRQHLHQIRDMIGQHEEEVGGEALANAEDSAPESGRNDEEEGAVGGLTSDLLGQDNSNVDWILNYGFEDPEIITKLRQLQAARERVMNLKQTNQTAQLPAGTSRYHNETNDHRTSQSQTEESDTDATTTDTESNASSSVNAMAWQDDPEFQDKIRKLKSAKTKLKQLQELVKRVHQFPDSAPVLPTELAELSFDDDDDDDDEQEESSESDYDDDDGNEERDANQDSESTSLQDEQSTGLPGDTVSDQEAEYQIRMQKQKNELARLLEERERLMEMQQSLSRLTQQQQQQQQSNALLQTAPVIKTETTGATTRAESKPTIRNTASPSLLRTDTFTVHKPTVPVISRRMNDSSTQTTTFDKPAVRKTQLSKVNSVDSSEAARAAPTSSALVWSELRRQRELHEEKLKKRKHRLLNEKRKKAGLDDVSEGGTYSLRSADIDEGFGVSMMSADITTATWGGSTQPSSTQNDSAVSEDGSETANQEIAVEVEDDYPDGIVQAEEEEEQHGPDTYPRDVADVFRSRARVRRTFPSGNSRPPRKRGRISKGLTFAWPKIGSDRSPRHLRQQNFIPSEGLIEEREQEQLIQERQAWEQQCGQLHGEVAKLTDMCNNLLRDQQALVSALIGRSNLPGMPMPSPLSANTNPFSQYQQKEQNAYQSYFDQQRYLFQHEQLLQTLNHCYAQLHQQQSDIGFLQGQFQQLISGNSTSPMANAPPSHSTTNPFKVSSHVPAAAGFPSLHTFSNPSTSSMYTYPPPPASNSVNFSIFQGDGVSQTPPGFTPATLNQSDLRWPSGTQSAAQTSTSRAPSWMPVFSDPFKVPPQSTQTDYSADPDMGVPSTRYSAVRSDSSPGTAANFVAFEEPIAPQPSVNSGTAPVGYNPSAYAEASGAVVSSTTQSNKSPFVVGRSFPTPLRELAAANLAKKNFSSLKRGHESVETSSRTSSVPGEAQDPSKGTNQEMDRASDAGSEFSLFEALRDSIYSEVATLISLNESRPHFLIELFRELQLLTSDYLRQRALYALRDIVTRFLTEDSIAASIIDKTFQQARFQAWVGSNSELTPSETVETSEDETRDVAEAAQIVTEGVYDYAENAESGSTLSTPTSSHTGDPPFASEGLGETVIHFDQTLSKMREYERLREQGKLSQLKKFAFMEELTTSSAGDVGSDSSFSDVQYPRIDTQALDHQIKSIMSEVIPYLNEHMEDTCTEDLLGYVRGLVLSRIQVREEQEFGRFFHKQLASILQDSLSKFENKKMKDCGEDMLVDMSEILFNELAFFKLMQDLDGTSARNREPFWRQESQSGTDTGTGQEADKEDEEQEDEKPEDSATEETESTMREKSEENIEQKDDDTDSSDNDSASSSSEDSEAEDEATGGDDERAEEDEPAQISQEQKEAEEECLGKERDDNMATQFEDMPESSKDSQAECVKLELSVSESKPFTSAGSGEEDGEESYDDLQSKRTLEDCEGGTAAAGRDSTDSDGSDAPQDDQVLPEHLHNGQAQEEHDEVVIDDLPTKLTGLTEADLQARIAEEQSRTQGTQAVLQHIAGAQELVGDPNDLSEPETTVVNGSPEGENEIYL